MEKVTVTYSHNYQKDKIDALESDPNVEIINRKTWVGDTLYLMPLHKEPHPSYLMNNTTYTYRIIPKRTNEFIGVTTRLRSLPSLNN